MRSSGQAQCPQQKVVADPTDTNYSIQQVFFNICVAVEGTQADQDQVSLSCI